MREHLDELALLETLDAGKPIGDTTSVDVPGAAYCVEWFAEAIDKMGGEVAPADHHLVGLVTREPIGVVAAVVPWNFPILMASWKFGPALAAGNSVVLKPSEKSPLTAIRIAQLAHEAGIPAGVFNVVPGAGEPGKLLALHPRRRLPRLHRLDQRRQADHAICGAVESEARVARTRRQVAEHRDAGLSRSRPRSECCGGRDLLQHGRDVHGGLAPARASRYQGRRSSTS